MKHLEDTPWWICDEGDVNYVAYSDTDSIYIHAEPLLRFLNPDFDELDDKTRDKKLEEIALEYQDIITKSYDKLATECFNAPKHCLEMKTEAVIRAAYFRATRRYAQWITKEEGIEKEDFIDIKGLEFKKANFPPLFGAFFEDILKQVLKGAGKMDILNQIKEFKNKILDEEIEFKDLGNPTAIKTLRKYTGKKPRAGEIFTEVKLKAPASVRAAIRYNDLLRLWGLEKHHNYITQIDKVKWVYLKDNPYKIDALAYLQHNIPDKILEFITKYIDRKAVFDSILLSKLEGFFEDLNWSLDLNPHLEKFKTIEEW